MKTREKEACQMINFKIFSIGGMGKKEEKRHMLVEDRLARGSISTCSQEHVTENNFSFEQKKFILLLLEERGIIKFNRVFGSFFFFLFIFLFCEMWILLKEHLPSFLLFLENTSGNKWEKKTQCSSEFRRRRWTWTRRRRRIWHCHAKFHTKRKEEWREIRKDQKLDQCGVFWVWVRSF